MKILITGVTGFVGTNIVNAFKGKHTIYGLDIVKSDNKDIREIYSWDNLDMLPEVDAIIHLAGKAHDMKNKSLATSYFDINAGLTKKIYDYFLKSSAKKFVFFSSVKAAADFVPGDILTEEVIPAPVGPYGESKIVAENFIIDASRDMKDKTYFILRPCMIHGPGNKGNLNLLYNVVSKGIPWPLGAFENSRSFTSIDNLTFAIENMLNKDIESGIYNIGDDEPLSTNDLIRLIAESVDKNPRIMNLSQSFMTKMANVGGKMKLPLNPVRLQKLTENYVVSNKKLLRALEIDRMPVGSKEGIRKTLKSFR